MIKYTNLFLAALCIAAGTLAIMINFHKPNKNMSTSTTKTNDSYKIKSTTNDKWKLNLNIKNLNFSLNDNRNNLNKITLKSEESVYGFKNIYTLASLPNKILKVKKEINEFNKKITRNNIQSYNMIKGIETSFV